MIDFLSKTMQTLRKKSMKPFSPIFKDDVLFQENNPLIQMFYNVIYNLRIYLKKLHLILQRFDIQKYFISNQIVTNEK